MTAATGISLLTTNDPFPPSPSWWQLDGPWAASGEFPGAPYGFVNSFKTTRGRPNEFSPQEAGQASIDLDNRTGAFDARFADGPFFGHLVGLRQLKINVQHPIRGTYHDVFTGYVENWDYKRSGPRAASTTATLVDMLALLANADVNTALGGVPYGAFYAAAHWDDRIKAALADAGVPSSWYEVATGNINVPSHPYDASTKCLEVILDAVEAEFPYVSNCFVSAAGKFRASGRFIRGVDGSDPTIAYPSWSVLWRCGDAASCIADPTLIPIYDLEWQRGKDSIKNVSLITPDGATEGAVTANYVQSTASISHYGRRADAVSGVQILDADDGNSGLDECKTFSNWVIANYADAHDRIKAISFRGQMDDGSTAPGGASGNLWDFILGVDINHIVEVTTIDPPGGVLADGSVDFTNLNFSADQYFVESISHDVSRLNDRMPNWTMSLDLSRRATVDWSPIP